MDFLELPCFTFYLFPQLGFYSLILFTVQMTLTTVLLRIGYEVQQYLSFTSFECLLIHVYFFSHQLGTGLECHNADSLQTGVSVPGSIFWSILCVVGTIVLTYRESWKWPMQLLYWLLTIYRMNSSTWTRYTRSLNGLTSSFLNFFVCYSFLHISLGVVLDWSFTQIIVTLSYLFVGWFLLEWYPWCSLLFR